MSAFTDDRSSRAAAADKSVISTAASSVASRRDDRIHGFFRMLRRSMDKSLQQLHRNVATNQTDEVELLRRLEEGLQTLSEWNRPDVVEGELQSVLNQFPTAEAAYQEAGLAYAQKLHARSATRLRVSLPPLRDFLGHMYNLVVGEPDVLSGKYFQSMSYRDRAALLQMAFEDALRGSIKIRRSGAPASRVAARSSVRGGGGGGPGASAVSSRRSRVSSRDHARSTVVTQAQRIRQQFEREHASLAPEDSVSKFPESQPNAEIDRRSIVSGGGDDDDDKATSEITQMRLDRHRAASAAAMGNDETDDDEPTAAAATAQSSSNGGGGTIRVPLPSREPSRVAAAEASSSSPSRYSGGASDFSLFYSRR